MNIGRIVTPIVEMATDAVDGATKTVKKKRVLSEEAKRRIGEGRRRYLASHPYTDEDKAKISRGMKKSKAEHPVSEETKAKISQSMKTYKAEHPVSEETRAKISQNRRGIPMSEERKAQNAEWMREYRAQHPELAEMQSEAMSEVWKDKNMAPLRQTMVENYDANLRTYARIMSKIKNGIPLTEEEKAIDIGFFKKAWDAHQGMGDVLSESYHKHWDALKK